MRTERKTLREESVKKNTQTGIIVIVCIILGIILLSAILLAISPDLFFEMMFGSGELACEICCLVPILAIMGVIAAVYAAVRRITKEKLQAYCDKHGYTYVGDPSWETIGIMYNTPVWKGDIQGGEACVKIPYKNFVLTFFIYNYLVYHKDSKGRRTSTTYEFCVLTTPITLSPSGKLYMRKEKMLDKMSAAFGKNDLDFEHKEFSDYYYVSSKPERLGYQFFSPRMIELFLNHRDFEMIITDGHIILFKPFNKSFTKNVGYLIKKDTPVVHWLEKSRLILTKALDLIPSYLVDAYQVEAVEVEEEPVVAELVEEETASVASESSSGPTLIECPSCSFEFYLPAGITKVKCPKCKLEGEI